MDDRYEEASSGITSDEMLRQLNVGALGVGVGRGAKKAFDDIERLVHEGTEDEASLRRLGERHGLIVVKEFELEDEGFRHA